jgi:hypothetical protein
MRKGKTELLFLNGLLIPAFACAIVGSSGFSSQMEVKSSILGKSIRYEINSHIRSLTLFALELRFGDTQSAGDELGGFQEL